SDQSDERRHRDDHADLGPAEAGVVAQIEAEERVQDAERREVEKPEEREGGERHRKVAAAAPHWRNPLRECREGTREARCQKRSRVGSASRSSRSSCPNAPTRRTASSSSRIT